MRGRPKIQQDALKRSFGDLPLADAENDLRIQVMPDDLVDAERKNPGHCALAQAAQRQFGAQEVQFLRTKAYVEVRDEEGNPKVERFILSGAARKLVADFDAGHEIETAGRMVVLMAPTGAKTLEGERLVKRDRVKRTREGAHKPKRRKHKQADYTSPLAELDVRSGSGVIQNTTN